MSQYREDGTPINFGGNKEAYDKYLAKEEERKQYNLDTAADRHAAKANGEYYPSYDDYSGGGRYSGSGGGMSDAQRKLQEAINAQVQALQNSKGGVGRGYDDIAGQQYVLFRQNQTKMPSQMAGRADGDIASLQLQANANYQNSLSDTLRAKEDALLGIDNNILQVKADGNMQLAQAAEKKAQEDLAYQRQQAEAEANKQWQKEYFDYQQSATNQSYKDKLALQSYYDNLNSSKTSTDYQINDSVTPTGGGSTSNTGGGTEQSIYNQLREMGVSDSDATRMVANGTWSAYLGGAR